MKKKLLTLLLAVCTVLSLTMTACAAQEEPEPSPLSTASQVLPFTDIPTDAWYADEVQYCYEHGIFAGTSSTTFSPEDTLTRAQLATVLYRMAGRPAINNENLGYPFTDVPGDSWYTDGVYWARLKGLMGGYGNNVFGPDDPVTREQAVTILWRQAGSPAASAGNFSDGDHLATWAETAAGWALGVGLLAGWAEGTFQPRTSLTRAEATVLMARYQQRAATGTEDGSRILVVYFSATGTTRPLAEYAADILNADLYEIVPAEPYTAADLTYYTDCRADREQNDPSARPAIYGTVENMTQYDVILLGYPIWHGQPPRIVSTFLESYDFSGKTIVPFCTSGSSGFSDRGLRALTSGANWLTGCRFAGGAGREAVAEWLDSLDLPRQTDGDLLVSFHGHTYAATLTDDASGRAFAALLAARGGSLTVEARDYGAFEKVGALPASLPRSDQTITTAPGDLILYQGDQIALYYAPNTWNFTRLGRLQGDLSALRDHLGSGSVSITYSLAAAQTAPAFDLETGTVTLNSGYEMPIMGLGTYSLSDEACYNSVTALLEKGGRLIDTAYMYHNEAAVGRAVRDSDMPREEIFVITKLYPSQFGNAEAAIDEALEKLDIGYIDLMLLHHPGAGDVEAYRAMERAVADGKLRSIGLSNWYVKELEEFLPQVSIPPALVQNEIHPYYQEQEVVPYIQSLGIVTQGWYPFGGRGHTAELLGDPVIADIAKNHGVTPAQVILRWNLQRGVVVIPGSSNPEHIRENLDLFNFALTEREMAQIAALDRNEKHDWY